MTEHDEITALRARVAELERERDERQRDAESMAYTAAMAINELRDVQNVSAILREMRARADAAEARVAELDNALTALGDELRGVRSDLHGKVRQLAAAEARVARLAELVEAAFREGWEWAQGTTYVKVDGAWHSSKARAALATHDAAYKAAEARVAELTEALRWYANPDNWAWHRTTPDGDVDLLSRHIMRDRGDIARAALAATRRDGGEEGT